MIFEHSNYRTYLKSVLAERIARNPSYSLRALAKALSLQPSHLSAIHGGAKNLSAERALGVARRLGLKGAEAEYFCLLVQYENAKSPDLKESYRLRLQALNAEAPVQDLSLDAFKVISDWYHIPIIEMTGLSGFAFTPANIARRLGIAPLEAEVAIERLKRLELIECDESGRWRKVHFNAVFKSSAPSQALRRFHKQMLEKAIDALETQAPRERYVGSQTFAIDESDFEGVRRIVDDFRQAIVARFNGTNKKRSQVYHLGIQIFNLTKGKKNETK